MTTISAHSLLRRTENHLETELDGEAVLMHIGSGDLYGFADTAKEIWEQLSAPMSFGNLIDHLIEQFEVDRDTCITEVSQFLFELEKQDIIEIDITEMPA